MPRRALAVCAIVVSAVFGVLDGSMLNVALPRIAADTGLTPSATVWLLNAYLLTVVVLLLPMGVLGERLGYARVFRVGQLLFAAGALACALAPGPEVLLAARIAQGIGSGCAMSCSAALLRASYPGRLFATGLGINTMAVTLAAAAGPAISSTLLTIADWRWLFALSGPAGLLAWACAHALPTTARRHRPLDPRSIGLNAGAMGLTILGLDRLARDPWLGLVLLAAAALLWRTWVRRDARQEAPLLPLDLFALPRFRYAIATSAMMFATQMTCLVALPFYLPAVRELSLAQTAALLTCWPVGATTVTAFTGRLLPRFGAARLCMTGAVSMLAGLAWIVLAPPGTATLLAPGLLLGGMAVGLFQTPNTHDMLSAPPRARAGAAGSMQAIARVGGQTLGASLAGLGLALADSHDGTLALGLAACVALGVLGLNIRRARLHAGTPAA